MYLIEIKRVISLWSLMEFHRLYVNFEWSFKEEV